MIQVTRETLLSLSAREGSSSSPWLRNANRVVVAVGLAVSTSALIMRIYTKARIMKKFWWDDVMILMAWSSSVAVQTAILCIFAKIQPGICAQNG
ncbi:uncharacterized protein N7503_011490 [Penicillium pulvis]|uniref:uncharacterized protein n=1 Tax=Penicillium pulvis TaxID=1562058 RepID=UPI00254972E4|nr:uncharacterized protein N7503_011490 [Penicillium pulvis]KAJ5786278.1 hypothetical protein N7503_011490 [Penicillium pulvis]